MLARHRLVILFTTLQLLLAVGKVRRHDTVGSSAALQQRVSTSDSGMGLTRIQITVGGTQSSNGGRNVKYILVSQGRLSFCC